MPHPILCRAVGLYRTSRYGTVSVCRVAHVLHARGVVRFDSIHHNPKKERAASPAKRDDTSLVAEEDAGRRYVVGSG